MYLNKDKSHIVMKDFLNIRVLCNKDINKSYELIIEELDEFLALSYYTVASNQYGVFGKKKHSLSIPKFIKRNTDFFEVLGLLQAEMGKKFDGKLSFCNHEYVLINKVVNWFEKEFCLTIDGWKWCVKLNIKEPSDMKYKTLIEQKVIEHWIKNSNLNIKSSYPKKVTYIKNTKNTILKLNDFGSLIIERKSNLFSQIIKNIVKTSTFNILNNDKEEIRSYMKGIIAGEGCVELNKSVGIFRVRISAQNPDEKQIYHDCLQKLNLKSIIYPGDALVISKKENNLELLKQGLVDLSPEKSQKFLKMIASYK